MESAFKQLLDQHNRMLYKIGRSYTTNHADFDDLYQEMLIQLWKAYPRFRGDAKVSTWLYRVALNTALTFTRKTKRNIWFQPIEDASPVVDNSEELKTEEAEQQKQIDRMYYCINQLSKDDRAIILLHLEGKSYEDMAEIIGVGKSNLGVKLMRLKKRLAKMMGELQHDNV